MAANEGPRKKVRPKKEQTRKGIGRRIGLERKAIRDSGNCGWRERTKGVKVRRRRREATGTRIQVRGMTTAAKGRQHADSERNAPIRGVGICIQRVNGIFDRPQAANDETADRPTKGQRKKCEGK